MLSLSLLILSSRGFFLVTSRQLDVVDTGFGNKSQYTQTEDFKMINHKLLGLLYLMASVCRVCEYTHAGCLFLG